MIYTYSLNDNDSSIRNSLAGSDSECLVLYEGGRSLFTQRCSLHTDPSPVAPISNLNNLNVSIT
jgi:hypothetical protein